MQFDLKKYLQSVIHYHSLTSVNGTCDQCGYPQPCKILVEAKQALAALEREEKMTHTVYEATVVITDDLSKVPDNEQVAAEVIIENGVVVKNRFDETFGIKATETPEPDKEKGDLDRIKEAAAILLGVKQEQVTRVRVKKAEVTVKGLTKRLTIELDG